MASVLCMFAAFGGAVMAVKTGNGDSHLTDLREGSTKVSTTKRQER